MHLVIGDLFLSHPVEYLIGQVVIHPPVEDLSNMDYEPVGDEIPCWRPKPTVKHTFAPPPKKPNNMLALVFTFVTLTPLGIFCFFIFNSGSTLAYFPNFEHNYIHILGFPLTIGSTLILLTSYWIGINFFAAVGWLSVLSVLMAFFGFRSLKCRQIGMT